MTRIPFPKATLVFLVFLAFSLAGAEPGGQLTMVLSPLTLTGLVVVLPMAVVKWDLDEPQWVRTFPAHRTLAYSPLL